MAMVSFVIFIAIKLGTNSPLGYTVFTIIQFITWLYVNYVNVIFSQYYPFYLVVYLYSTV